MRKGGEEWDGEDGKEKGGERREGGREEEEK